MSPLPPPNESPRARPSRLRRALLGLLALGALASPAIASGCAAAFTPASQVESLRVLAVSASKPYANPGDEVTFTMTYHDGLAGPDDAQRPVQIVWLGGCFNPPGDQYFACYEQLAELFSSLSTGQPPPPEYFAGGIGLDTFTTRIPEDILTSREQPPVGPAYGIAYVFFAACAGQIGPVEDPGGNAGAFPLGCFDAEGRRLGAESFVPGYTQIYVFGPIEDTQGNEILLTNENPEIGGLTLDGEEISEDFAEIPTVQACPVPEDERRAAGCGAQDPSAECTTYEIKGIVDPGVAEPDLSGQTLDGEELSEVVWINYYADQGEFESDIKLVNEATEGYLDDFGVQWIPPSEPGIATLWAVLRDARGGSSVVRRLVRVE